MKSGRSTHERSKHPVKSAPFSGIINSTLCFKKCYFDSIVAVQALLHFKSSCVTTHVCYIGSVNYYLRLVGPILVW